MLQTDPRPRANFIDFSPDGCCMACCALDDEGRGVMRRTSGLLLFLSTAVLMNCTSVMTYSPQTGMSRSESEAIIEELLRTQHRAWKPEYVSFNDAYVAWGGGRPQLIRIHYTDVDELGLYSWRRKFTLRYVVQVVQKERKGKINVLRTRRLDDAKRFLDAFNSLLAARRVADSVLSDVDSEGSPANGPSTDDQNTVRGRP